ncbi:hypothetical protein PUN28_005766 [Cardiocondyla obscurior]|uniref:Uncharacterized protein n=1 Tax=Cardiocondyla obscurior TaxID=286306 RepID=A0AAW2G5N3_9HYME
MPPVHTGERQNTIIPMSKEQEFHESIPRRFRGLSLLASVEDLGSYADEWRYGRSRLHIHFAFHVEHEGGIGRRPYRFDGIPKASLGFDGCLTSNETTSEMERTRPDVRRRLYRFTTVTYEMKEKKREMSTSFYSDRWLNSFATCTLFQNQTQSI